MSKPKEVWEVMQAELEQARGEIDSWKLSYGLLEERRQTLANEKFALESKNAALREELNQAKAMYTDQRYAYNEQKKIIGALREEREKLERLETCRKNYRVRAADHEKMQLLAESYRAKLQQIVDEGIDTSTDGGMEFVRAALAQEKEERE